MRTRRAKAEILLSRIPARSSRGRQAVPVSVETPKLWPLGSTWDQACEWWADVRRDAEQTRLDRRAAANPRPSPAHAGEGRSYFLHFRHPAKRWEAGKTAGGSISPPFSAEFIKGTQPMKPKKPMIILGTILKKDARHLVGIHTTYSSVHQGFVIVSPHALSGAWAAMPLLPSTSP